MKRGAKLLAALGLAAMLAGCVQGSLWPLYTDKEVIFDAGLLGKWKDPDPADTNIWTFTKRDDKAYTLTVEWETEEGGKDSQVYAAYLMSLGMYTFLDLYPAPTEAEKAVIEKYGYVGTHDQFLVKREEDTLQTASLDEDWLEEQILEGEVRPRVAALGQGQNAYVLIGRTRELQKWFVYAAANPDAFPDFTVMKRVR